MRTEDEVRKPNIERPRSAVAASPSSALLDTSGSFARRQRPGSAATPLARSASAAAIAAAPTAACAAAPSQTYAAAPNASMARAARATASSQSGVAVCGAPVPILTRGPTEAARELGLARKMAALAKTRAAITKLKLQAQAAGGGAAGGAAGAAAVSIDLRTSISHARALEGVTLPVPTPAERAARPSSAGQRAQAAPWHAPPAAASGGLPARPASAGHKPMPTLKLDLSSVAKPDVDGGGLT